MLEINYNYYTNTYLGSLITDESEFNRIIKQQVRPKLNKITFNRIDSVTDDVVKNSIKDTFCACADIIKSHTSEDGTTVVGNVTSETVGPWHRTYGAVNTKAGTLEDNITEQLRAKAYYYLGDTGLMYAGC